MLISLLLGVAAVLSLASSSVVAAEPPAIKLSTVVSLDGSDWRLATDPKNVGRDQKWFERPTADAKPTKVPWVIQDIFSDYHGVAWYWREFDAPVNPHPGGRYLLRFHAVDYRADVWVNGQPVGSHEGGETPFVLDVTESVKPGQKNLLGVRVLNPTYQSIDGYLLKQTPSGAKQYPVQTNAVYNSGGIVDSVELLVAPVVRVEDIQVIPDWKTGDLQIRANLRNAGQAVDGSVLFTVAPAVGGETVATSSYQQSFRPGDGLVEVMLHVPNHRLWELNDPQMYRVTVRVQANESRSADECSVRCGFRDFRFENGYFRLNGRRIFPHSGLYLVHYPIGHTCPPDPDMMRRDVLNMKALGLNMCRITFGGATAKQLDIFDELGILVYIEHYASWQLDDSPQMVSRFDRSLGEIVRRDRNHPSVVVWGFLNETYGGPLFRRAVDALSLIRTLDQSRMCSLNSGRWDGDSRIGSLSNPGSKTWEVNLREVHRYPPVPHTASVLRDLAGAGQKLPEFLSEYGQCGAVDLPLTLRHFEQRGRQEADDARYFRRQLEHFRKDWKLWGLDQCWVREEDFFAESQRNFAKLRLAGENAVRANPNLVAYSSTYSIADQAFNGCGVANAFRELKPGLADAVRDTSSPLRWSLFVEPVNAYRGGTIKLSAVLSNLDVLRPGKYPARVQVIGPRMTRLLDKQITVEVPGGDGKTEPPFAFPVYAEDIKADGASGKYRYLVTFEQGGAASGGEAEFYVADPVEMPPVSSEVVLWGEDAGLAQWLAEHNIPTRSFSAKDSRNENARDSAAALKREVILAAGRAPAPGGAKVFGELAEHIARGSTVVFLEPGVFVGDKDPVRWLPLARKGRLESINWVAGYYRSDPWAKSHPIFDGLPSGGIMDPGFYREIIPQQAFVHCYTIHKGFMGFLTEEAVAELDSPAEAVCGANRLSANYASGLHVAVYELGAGRFLLNNLKIRENLGRDPVAERLLRNMLRYAARDIDKPPAELPASFDAQLKLMGY